MCDCIYCPGHKKEAGGGGVCLIQYNDSGKKVCKCTGCDGVCAGTVGTDWCEDCWDREKEECMFCACCDEIHSLSGLIMDRDAYMACNSDTELEIALRENKNVKNAERRVAYKAKKEKQKEKTRAAKKAMIERRDADPKGKEAAGGSVGSVGSGGSAGTVVSSGSGGSTGIAGTGGSGGSTGTAGSAGSGSTADTAASGATGDATGTDAEQERVTPLLSLPGTTRENPVIL